MKKFIAILFLALCSLALATPGEPAALPADDVALADSVVIDSALYYEDKAIDLKLDGDYLMTAGLGDIVGGTLVTALGGAGVVVGAMLLLEGGLGTMLSLFVLPPTSAIAAAGITSLANGISSRSEGRELYRQSDEMYKKSNELRTNGQQVKVDVVPLINPLTGTAGMNVALRF